MSRRCRKTTAPILQTKPGHPASNPLIGILQWLATDYEDPQVKSWAERFLREGEFTGSEIDNGRQSCKVRNETVGKSAEAAPTPKNRRPRKPAAK